jgi:hypothetical protein
MAQRNRTKRGFTAAVKRGWNSKPTAIVAVVVVVVVLAVVLFSTLLGVFAPATSNGQNPTTPPAPSRTSAAEAGPCNVRVTDTSSTPKMPSDLTWKTGAEGLTWPVSKSVGPTKTIDGFDACFARSPLGAALAAQTVIYSQYDPKVPASKALGFYIADSAGKAKTVSGSAGQNDASLMRTTGLNPAGFTVDSFTRDRADVTLVYSYPSSSTGYAGLPCSVVWTGDDWKLSVLDNGALFSGDPTNPSVGDFVPWGGDSQ